MFDQTLGFFHDNLRHLGMTLRRLIKCGANDFGGFDLALPVGNFFRSFINQEDNQDNFRMIRNNGPRHSLQEHGLSRSGSRHDQSPLPLANGRREFHHSRAILFRIKFKVDPLFRIQRSEVIEQNFIPLHLRLIIINFFDFQERKIPLSVLRRTNLP